MQDAENLKTGETPRDKFIRLGNKRMENACDFIDLIENLLKNRNAYTYDNRDVEIIIRRLHNKIEGLKKYWHVDPLSVTNQGKTFLHRDLVNIPQSGSETH